MTRWILAFDGGCSACSQLVERVQAVVGPRLDVQSLSEQVVRDMRAKVFGENAPWMPTLLAVDGDRVRAWTGPRLSWRLGRLLGPAQSMRVMRSISASRGLENADRRTLLTRGGLGAAGAAALVLTGGSSTALAAIIGERKNKKIPVHEAARQFFGISAADITIEPKHHDAEATLRYSAASAEVISLLAQFRRSGLTVEEPLAYSAELPIRGRRPAHSATLDVTRYQLRNGSHAVGEICWVSGPKGSITVAYASRDDGTVQIYAYDSKGLREHGIFDRGGRAISGTEGLTTPVMVSPDTHSHHHHHPHSGDIGCLAICALLCNTGWAGGLAGCITACALSGPGEVLCAPICALLVAGACLLGCAWVCCSCCGEC